MTWVGNGENEPMGDRKAMQDDLNATTRQVPQYDKMSTPSQLPTLTILYHPRLQRIGERVRLEVLGTSSQKVAISRLEPEFAPPFNPEAALPLASSFLSRSPVWLMSEHNSSFTIDVQESTTAVIADGVTVTETHNLSRLAVERGVVLEIGGQIVLLLHLMGAQTRQNERFGLVGDSDGIQMVRQQITRVAKSGVPVLVRGETGTGKELVAEAVHYASDRAKRPYLIVNMAAIPSTLAAAELFGYVRGAFSGAKNASDGFFGRAHNGTLFMDEVGDTPPEVQAALLRVLETGEVQQIGADKIKQVDVRLIAATDADIAKEVEAGRFRAPLFYRLANQEIRIPPLSERRDDIGRLLLHFLISEFENQGREAALLELDDVGMSWLPAGIVSRLARYHWPGNVRQLRNVARYLASIDEPGRLPVNDPSLNRLLPTTKSASETIETSAAELQRSLADHLARLADGTPGAASEPASTKVQKRRAPSEIDDDELVVALAAQDYKLGPTAAKLGISRPALNDLIDAHDTLVRANTLTKAQIGDASAACEGDLDKMWRHLHVSRRGLKLRMSQLE
jgi:two-component system nitrogen regulation response regulator GlnG